MRTIVLCHTLLSIADGKVTMPIDKQLYREALAQYRQWNTERARLQQSLPQPLSAATRWQQYVELVELGWHLHPVQSDRQRGQKIAAIETYYERVRRLEAWRNEHGK